MHMQKTVIVLVKLLRPAIAITLYRDRAAEIEFIVLWIMRDVFLSRQCSQLSPPARHSAIIVLFFSVSPMPCSLLYSQLKSTKNKLDRSKNLSSLIIEGDISDFFPAMILHRLYRSPFSSFFLKSNIILLPTKENLQYYRVWLDLSPPVSVGSFNTDYAGVRCSKA